MTGDRYVVINDPYLYRDTDCLKNRAGLRDSAALQAFEIEMSSLRAEERLPAGTFDARHYQAVHRHLFQDVYRWAGRYRTVRTGKGGNWFCYPDYIAAQMDHLMLRLSETAFMGGTTSAVFVPMAAEWLAELNAIHPFREGNGRTQLVFLYLVSMRAGHELDFARIEPDSFLDAMIVSFGGNLAPLTEAIDKLRM